MGRREITFYDNIQKVHVSFEEVLQINITIKTRGKKVKGKFPSLTCI